MQRLGPTKKKKEKEKKWVYWLFWPLDCLYALNREWTLYKRWVTDQWELITHKGVSFTQQISSLALICDAKTWSHKKKEKEKQWVCWLFRPLDCLYALNREWALYKRWVTDQWELITHKGVSFTQQISSLALICDAKTWSHKKKEKEKQWVCWLFRPLDCLYALNREWTLYKRWVTKSWSPTKESVPPNKSLP